MEKEEHTVLWILTLGLALFLSLIYDKQIASAVQGMRNQLLNFYFLEFSLIFTAPIIILVVTIFLINQRRFIIPWWMASITVLFFSLALKVVVARERPFVIYDDLIPLTREAMHSFPSVRTAVAFSAIPLLSKYFHRFLPFWIILALIVGFSRIYLGLHFLSDVIAGILIGYLLGKMIMITGERTHKI